MNAAMATTHISFDSGILVDLTPQGSDNIMIFVFDDLLVWN